MHIGGHIPRGLGLHLRIPSSAETVWERMMAILKRSGWSKRVKSMRSTAWSAVLAVGVVVSGCGHAPATADAGVASQPVTPTQSTSADTAPTTIQVEGSCIDSKYPFVSLLAESEVSTAVVGKIVSPDIPKGSYLAKDSDGNPLMVYSEFDAVIDRSLAGPQLETRTPLSFRGGESDGAVTDIDKHMLSAWAKDGSFLGLVRADTEPRTGWAASTLPVVDGRVVFLNGNCFTPAGLKDVDKRSVPVLIFDNGTVAESSGPFQTASLDEIIESLAS